MISGQKLRAWKKLAYKRTDGELQVHYSQVAVHPEGRHVDADPVEPTPEDAEYLECAWTYFPQLIEEVERLREVARAAERMQNSLSRVYHGTPSKLEWPEWHVLRQNIEVWGGGRDDKA